MSDLSRVELKTQVYLNVAKDIAKLSKDENTQIGAVIVAKDGSPVSWGYNGTIPGFDDNEIPHSRDIKELSYYVNGEEKTFTENKYPFMEHAEANAIDFGDKNKMEGATMYVTGMPCKDCARKIAKRKISRVVVAEPSGDNIGSTVGNDVDLTMYFFSRANVELFIGNKQISLDSKTQKGKK